MGDKVVWLREALGSTFLHLKLALKQTKEHRFNHFNFVVW